MQSNKAQEFPDLARTLSRSRSRSRSTSMSSDSQLSRIHLFVPPPVNPAPSFIAPSAASQIITTDQEFNAADFVADDETDDSGALVTGDALSALNGFLDHLLFNILAAAKSTQLSAIRPAVSEVLKPRLAREVVMVADEELSEYLGDPEDEELEFRGGQNPNGEFDLIRAWKLTRLRCMVYTRLGDMEEDDEEDYIAQESLVDEQGAPRRFTNHIENITPAAAIFLTSIIEHLGEQALVIAGETARSRLCPKLVVEDDEETDIAKERGSMKRLVVEELDVEKLALNPTLGRLWRTWRKRTRAPHMSRMASRESILLRRGTISHLPHSRKSSFSVGEDAQSQTSPPPGTQPEIDPVFIPLPMSENDIQEIENLDVASDVEGGDIQTMEAVVAHKVRPQSLMLLTLQSPRLLSSSGPSPVTPVMRTAVTRHVRSRSLPSASGPPEISGVDQVADKPSPTMSEDGKRLETMYERDEHDDGGHEEGKAMPATESSKQDTKGQSPEDKSARYGVPDEQVETVATEVEMASRSSGFASAEIVTGPTGGDAEVASTFLLERETEVIEGQGLGEKPTVTSIQRLQRKPSTGRAQKDEPSSSGPSVSEPTVVEDPSDTQEDASAPVQPVTARDASTETTSPPSAESPVREFRPSLEGALNRGASNSGDSARSSYSRTHQPSPLVLTNGSPTSSMPSSATERAAVQRISGRPSTSAAPVGFIKSRRSDSVGSHPEKRPLTANSAASQVSHKLKGLISRPNESASPRLRSSSETSRVSGGTGGSFDDKSGLDELIRSEETIHYTLTPKSVREMDFPDTQAQQSDTADMADFLRNTGPDDAALPRLPTASSKSSAEFRTKPRSPDLPKHSPVHAAPSTGKPRPKVGQPRDARPSLESSSDFAQFIRSSGPSSPSHVVKSSIGRRLSDATELSKRPSRADSALSNPTRNRLQARPAAVPRGEQTSDLIDFIREGPPTVGARRIPRTVAPFRSTMDSDDLNAYDQGSGRQGAPSITSTQDESMATKSQVSVGSRTGLLDSANRTNIRGGPARMRSDSSGKLNTEEDTRPKRTQRRVPDPYAIDSDDDDLDELLEEPKQKREEESLIDFLRNVPPPESERQPQPFVPRNAPARNSTSAFGSASAMKARLLRNTSFEKTPSLKSSGSSLRQQPDHFTGTSNYAVKVGAERQGTIYGLASVSGRQTETSALADFLRNTGPPEPPVSRAPVKDTSLSRRLFVRRKKVEV